MGRFCLSGLMTQAMALACVEPKPTTTMKVMAVTELRAVLSQPILAIFARVRARWLGGPDVCNCVGFRTPAITSPATSSVAGVGKAPRHEIAGGEGTVGGAGAMGILAAASGWARLD